MTGTPPWLRYENGGATRNLPLSPRLIAALDQVMPALGLTLDVFSGGQPSSGPNRTGSHRHDEGNSADVFLVRDGRRLDWANPTDRAVFEQFVRAAKAAGLTGFGAGPGYMRPGSMHIGFGTPAVWGAEGKGANAPDWLRTAYGVPPAGGPAVASAPPDMPGQPPPVVPPADTGLGDIFASLAPKPDTMFGALDYSGQPVTPPSPPSAVAAAADQSAAAGRQMAEFAMPNAEQISTSGKPLDLTSLLPQQAVSAPAAPPDVLAQFLAKPKSAALRGGTRILG